MRNLILPSLLLAGLCALAACGKSTGDKEHALTALEPGMQTVSYAIGMDMGRQVGTMPGADDDAQLVAGLRERLAGSAKLEDDQAQMVMQAFMTGATDEEIASPDFASAEARRSYAVGVVLATLVTKQVKELDPRALTQGLQDQLAGGATLLAADKIHDIINGYQRERHGVLAAANQAEGEAFLAANAQREGVLVTPSGLQYEVLREGNGPRPRAESRVKVHYRGNLLDGTVFDSSYDRGEPITFPLNGVIAGWTEGVQLMPVGSMYKFFIPGNLAYGERGAGGDIGPNATLVFEVELLAIED